MTANCPPNDDLAAMLSGAMPDSQIEQMLVHIDGCSLCQAAIERLGSNDPLANQLSELRNFEPEPTSPKLDEILGVTNSDHRSSAPATITLPAEIGPYQLIRTIAVGGMATVYEARHRRLGRPFAFKLLHSGKGISRAQAERIRREWQTHGRLVHPNIVSATDAGIANGQPYLVTERVDGSDLSQMIRQTGPLDPADACELARQAAVGLSYAHEQRVLHRDVKPSNLMLDKMGTVKLLDLGTASWQTDGGVYDAGLHGTLHYIAPERFSGSCNEQSDIYSLGCTLYCLLVGNPPFHVSDHQSNGQLADAHSTVAPKPIADLIEIEPSIGKHLQSIIDRTLAKNLGDRFESMQELADALVPLCENHNVVGLLDGLQSQKEPPNWTEVYLPQGLTTLLRPRRTRSWSMVAFAIVCLIGGIVFAVIDRNPNLQRDSIVELAPRSVTRDTTYGENLIHRTGPVWQSSPRSGVLDGLVLEPAKFQGIDNWQIETIAPRGRIRCVRWSTEGTMIATVSTDGHIRRYDWEQAKLSLSQIVAMRGHRFISVDFDSQSSNLLACSNDTLFQINSSTSLIEKAVPLDDVRGMQMVPGYDLVSVACADGLHIFETETLEKQTTLHIDCEKFVWSQDGDRVACLKNEYLQVWRFLGGGFADEAVGRRNLEENPKDFAFSPSLSCLAVAYKRRVELLARGRLNVVRSFSTQDIASIQYGETDQKLAIGTSTGIRALLDTKGGAKASRFFQNSARSKVAWNPKGDCIAVGQDSSLRVVDADLETIDHIGTATSVKDVLESPSGACSVLYSTGTLVTVNQNGQMLGCRPLGAEQEKVYGFRLLPSANPTHVSVELLPMRDSPEAVELPRVSADTNRVSKPLFRHRRMKGVSRIEKFDPDQDQWESIRETPDAVYSIQCSPNGRMLAYLSERQHMTVLDLETGEPIFDGEWNASAYQNELHWINDESILIAGAMNMSERLMARFDVTSRTVDWLVREPHDCTAGEVARLDRSEYLQAGAVYHVRGLIDGASRREIDVEARYGRRHGRLYRVDDSECIYSWGFDFYHSYWSNASDSVMCWDVATFQPQWNLVAVNESESLTLSNAGQVISSTPKAMAGVRWMVETTGGIGFLTGDEFKRLVGEQ